MGVLKLAGLAGMIPSRDPRALPENAAVDAANMNLDGSGYLKGLTQPALIKALAGTTKSVFRIPLPGANTLANSYWMEFADENTDVLRAPIVNDSYERIYWASPSTGLKFAPKGTIIAGSAGLQVGVPTPTTAPTVTPVAGTGALDPVTGLNTGEKVTRSYVFTWVNIYGEESQPGLAKEATGFYDQDWLITDIGQPGAPGARAAYQAIRVYRTVTGLSGTTDFYKVTDLAIGTTFYTDTLSDEIVTAKGGIESLNWAEPPAGLQGLVAMPNGIFVSWKDNTLFFSENFRPHSWPAEYQLTVDFPIVGLGVFGNTCVVCTTGTPAMVSGVKASTMTLTKVDKPLPCLSRRSIMATELGVMFASEAGMVMISPNGVDLITDGLITRKEWQTRYKPETIKSIMTHGTMIAAHVPGVGTSEGFELRPIGANGSGGLSYLDLPNALVNLGVEPWTGKSWVIVQSSLYEWEPPVGAPYAYRWHSKEYRFPIPTNFSVYQAYFDTSIGEALHLKITVTLRGNDGDVAKVVAYDQDIVKSGSEIRLPGGFRADVWEFEFTGTAELQEIVFATTVGELRGA